MGKYKANRKINKNNYNKKIKETKLKSENENEIQQFIIILIVVLIIVLGIYLLSKLIVNKRDKQATNNTTATSSIDYSRVSVGTLLNRPYDEYYVMVYDSEDSNAAFYSSLITNFTNKGNKIYYCDLGNQINSKYVSKTNEGNKNAKSIDEMSFGKLTLLKVKNGKITLYLEDLKKIQSELNK